MKPLLLFLFPLWLAAADLKPLDEAAFARLVAAQKGKVTLVNFWATYCVPCRKEMPALVALHQRLSGKGFQLITISADEPEQEKLAAAFLDQTKVPAPTYIKRARDDDRFIRAIDPRWSGALPYTILHDKTGKRVKIWYGEVPLKELNSLLARLL